MGKIDEEMYENFFLKSKKKKIANKYLKISTLARGNFCSVKKCVKVEREDEVYEDEKENKKFYAIKIYSKRALTSQKLFVTNPKTNKIKIKTQLDEVEREIKILKLINHERCVKCYEVIDGDIENKEETKVFNKNNERQEEQKEENKLSKLRDSFVQSDTKNKIYIVMEFMELGSLMNFKHGMYEYLLPTDEFIDENLTKCIIRDVSLGLQYLHGIGLSHRDIKPQNVLMDKNGRVKIGDFGVAEFMNSECCVTNTKGTYVFMSPESLEITTEDKPYKGHDGRAADVWALGVTLWILLFRSVPFNASNAYKLFEKIITEELVIDDSIRKLSDETIYILKRLLEKDLQKRITISQLLEEPWINSADYSLAEKYAQDVINYRLEMQAKQNEEDEQKQSIIL